MPDTAVFDEAKDRQRCRPLAFRPFRDYLEERETFCRPHRLADGMMRVEKRELSNAKCSEEKGTKINLHQFITTTTVTEAVL